MKCEVPRQRDCQELRCDRQPGVQALAMVSLFKSKAASTSLLTHIQLNLPEQAVCNDGILPLTARKRGGGRKGWRERREEGREGGRKKRRERENQNSAWLERWVSCYEFLLLLKSAWVSRTQDRQASHDSNSRRSDPLLCLLRHLHLHIHARTRVHTHTSSKYIY